MQKKKNKNVLTADYGETTSLNVSLESRLYSEYILFFIGYIRYKLYSVQWQENTSTSSTFRAYSSIAWDSF